MTYHLRHLEAPLTRAMNTHPVVLLNGPRQAGKSTLAHHWGIEKNVSSISMDHPTHMAALLEAPYEYLKHQKQPLIINEIQLIPSLFRVIKRFVDEGRLVDPLGFKGKLLLTGSSNLMVLPELSDALVGRMGVKTLYPFSVSEAIGTKPHFLTELWSCEFENHRAPCSVGEGMQWATFPELMTLNPQDQSTWLSSYLTTLLQRDIKSLAQIDQFEKLPLLLRIVAQRSGGLINEAAIARDAGLNAITCKRYRQLLKAMFLTIDIPPWFRNLNKRLVKAPKSYFLDTVLLRHLVHGQNQPHLEGHWVENFVASELIKLLSVDETPAELYHFRTHAQQEIDFILERPDGKLAAIEVKNSESVHGHDFKIIKDLENVCSQDIVSGVVLYRGDEVIPFGEKLWAVPISHLFS